MIYTWTRNGLGYECSSKGDTRFSALYAKMPDGRTVEQHYQCDIKGYQPGGTNWKLGKGKPGLNPNVDLWTEYLNLWLYWSLAHPEDLEDLRWKSWHYDHCLKDSFATTPINQARALAWLLNWDLFA